MTPVRKIPIILIYSFCLFTTYSFVGFINTYLFDLKGASKDAAKFTELATEWAKYGELGFYVNSEFYAQFIGVFYRFFGASEFVSVQINILALFTVGIILNRFLKTQGVRYRERMLCIFIVGFWPTMVPRGAASMREPLMILSFIWIFYEIVNIQYRPALVRYVSLLSASFLGFSLHKAGAILVPVFLLFGGLYWAKSKTGSGQKSLYLLALTGGGIILVLAAQGSATLFDVAGLRELNSLLNQDTETIGGILDHKANISERASYHSTVDISSLLSMFLTMPMVFLNYMLQPFPQNVDNIYDVVAFFEVIVRVCLLGFLIRERAHLSKETWLLLLFYAASCFLWAAGTTNWGTAQRHHLTTNWMLFLAYFQHRYGFNLRLRRPANC
jgi:hypothetical protein